MTAFNNILVGQLKSTQIITLYSAHCECDYKFMVMASMEDPLGCLVHEHFYYVFSVRSRRFMDFVQDPHCEEKVTMGASYLKVWFEDKKCTYVCSHPNPTPAHAATITTTETRVPSASILFDLHGSSIPSTFNARDFSWIETGMFIPLSSLTDLVSDGYDSSSIASMAAGLAVRLKN